MSLRHLLGRVRRTLFQEGREYSKRLQKVKNFHSFPSHESSTAEESNPGVSNYELFRRLLGCICERREPPRLEFCHYEKLFHASSAWNNNHLYMISHLWNKGGLSIRNILIYSEKFYGCSSSPPRSLDRWQTTNIIVRNLYSSSRTLSGKEKTGHVRIWPMQYVGLVSLLNSSKHVFRLLRSFSVEKKTIH